MVWERNDLHSRGTRILKVYGQAHQRKSRLDIILTNDETPQQTIKYNSTNKGKEKKETAEQ